MLLGSTRFAGVDGLLDRFGMMLETSTLLEDTSNGDRLLGRWCHIEELGYQKLRWKRLKTSATLNGGLGFLSASSQHPQRLWQDPHI